jgi:DNA helicase-2/ATP-dependent DNA helicase PcrA
MLEVARLIGGAGTGKTTELLRLMEGVVEKLHDPHLIGFVSFTRAARREAASRAADRFDLRVEELEQRGWFRTLHSVCHRCLGVGQELLADSAESRDWIRNAIQEEVAGAGGSDQAPYAEAFKEADHDADRALALWQAARNRLEGIEPVWRQADTCDPRTPTLAYCRDVIDRYEQAKRLDHRLDFVDTLAAFAGYGFTTGGPYRCPAVGESPDLPVWFFDEQQDASALLDAVCQRLISSPSCQWVYVTGDPFQAIYGWAGADPMCFRRWAVSKERTMPKSYRCPAPILEMGERQLRPCTDYWDRRIQPADHAGEVEELLFGKHLLAEVNPGEDWLLLARTNYLAGRIAKLLTKAGIPWLPTRGGGEWAAPVRNAAIQALLNLEAGAPIDGRDWQVILKHLPSISDGTRLLENGTKTHFEGMTGEEAAARYSWMTPETLPEMGATDACVQAIRSKAWRTWIPESHDYAAAIETWGQEAVLAPKIRVGTIHSVKGAEADNVAVLTTISAPVAKSAATEAGRDEEQRVFYVACTRARKRLVICNELNPQYRKKGLAV